MTAPELARLLKARRMGRGKWRAACPAHAGSNKSALAIAEGKTAVLLKCFSHDCSVADIMAALGLKARDVFYTQGSDPKAIREAMRRAEAAERKAKREHKRCMYLADMVRTSERRVRELTLGSEAWHKALDTARVWCEHLNATRSPAYRTEIEP